MSYVNSTYNGDVITFSVDYPNEIVTFVASYSGNTESFESYYFSTEDKTRPNTPIITNIE